jgi:hypothetical protein
MKSAELKSEILRQVDNFDASKLEEFYGVMLNFINSKRDSDEWVGVSDMEKETIVAAINEMESGYGKSHAEVISKLRKKYPIA